MPQPKFNPHRSGLLLSLGVAVAVVITALIFLLTKQQRGLSAQEFIADQIAALLPEEGYDNNPAIDSIKIDKTVSPSFAVKNVYLYKTGKTVRGAVLHINTPQGYSGNIDMLVALKRNSVVHGVAIVAHTETPGLGDKIEQSRSDWLTQFNDLNAMTLPVSARSLKKDGGEFDQITGATITSRAVVNAVSDTIDWYARNRDFLQ